MKALLLAGTIALALIAGSSPCPVAAQAPVDLHIVATAGGQNGFVENRAIEILPDGSLTYLRFIPANVGGAPLETYTATLSRTQLDNVWQTIQSQNFFAMDAEYRTASVQDRTYARLSVTGGAASHEVVSANTAVPAFDAIMSAINGMMPAGKTLEYDVGVPDEVIPQEICPFGKRASDVYWTSPLAKANSVFEKSSSIAADAIHAGTVIAHRLSLKEAVSRGIIKLEGKGGYFGDQVSIEADNSANQKTDKVTITLYMEFYGADATETNVAKVKEGIEAEWGNKTATDGTKVDVNVVVRRKSDSATPPGTPGYHQIKMDRAAGVSYVTNFGGFGVNQGTGGGVFETVAPPDATLAKIYAHEAGHLLNLDDRYDDYNRQADGRWRKPDGSLVSSAGLATALLPRYPGHTQASLQAYLSGPGMTRVTPPHAGHANDLMGALDGTVRQSDIDALAAKANLVVEVRAGDILVNKSNSEQNLTVTHDTDLQVPVGGKKRIEGLYTACIDAHEGVPYVEQRFDVAPHLSEWAGVESAAYLLQLLEYVEANDRFCGSDFITQGAVWRITDNSHIGDVFVDDMLSAAGIDLGNEYLDFPRITSPSADDTTTGVAIPVELVNVETAPSGVLTYDTTPLTFESVIHVPGLAPDASEFAWSLVAPEGSGAQLTDQTAATVSFTPDVRGAYLLTLTVRLTIGDDTLDVDPWTALVVLADQWTDTFERATLSHKYSFAWTTTESAPWTLTEDSFNSGTKAAVSADIDDSETSAVEIVATLPEAGTISFAYRVSSEPAYDELVFSIDGSVQGAWSGEAAWTAVSFPVEMGQHVFRWAYEKDGSESFGLDAAWIDDIFFPVNAITIPVEDAAGDWPDRYALEQSHPNPVAGTAIIRYALPRPQRVRIAVFDLVGREVATVLDAEMPAGVHDAAVDVAALASGVYIYRMEAGTHLATQKLVVIH